VNSCMTVLLEETMKGYNAPHTVVTQYLKGWFALDYWTAQIDIHRKPCLPPYQSQSTEHSIWED